MSVEVAKISWPEIVVIDNGKPEIELGVQKMFGRVVEVLELDEPRYDFNPVSKTVQVMYFGVIDISFSGKNCIWLWDGYQTN